MTLRSLWQTRRVIGTKDLIAFARVGSDKLVDCIPLSEVKAIHHISEKPSSESNMASSKRLKFINTLKNGEYMKYISSAVNATIF